jgi:hypothetical protein
VTKNLQIAYSSWINVANCDPDCKHRDENGYLPTCKAVGQDRLHKSKARFRLVMAGRQSGKSLGAIAEICIDALGYPGHVNWWVVNNLEVKERAWRGLLNFLPKGVLEGKPNETQRRIRLANGSEIWVKSAAGDDSLVSESLDFVVCDEAGLWKAEAWERGISPMLLARPNSRVVFVSTPRSKNWFYKMWLKGRSGPYQEPGYESFHWKSEHSPYADPTYLAERRRNMPADLYREEYEADPLDTAGGVFKNVRDRVLYRRVEADRFTVIGVDLAQKNDYTAIIPMNSLRQAISVERSQDDYSIQKQRLAALSFQMNFARLVVDEANVGLMMTQELRSAGMPVEAVATNSAVVKRSLIDNLRIAFESGTITIPDDPVLINELESYTYELLPSGQIRYAAPEGEHDDTVIALALATWGQRGAMARTTRTQEQFSYLRPRGGWPR